MENIETEFLVGARAWASFPVSVAVIFTAIVPLFFVNNGNWEEEAFGSLIVGAGLWFLLSLFRRLFPDIFMRNLWNCCSIVVLPIGTWIIKFPVICICCGITIANGVSLVNALLFYCGLLLLDFLF